MTIRALLVAFSLLCATIAPASAQGCGPTNPNCVVITAPNGDNTNKAASTKFVQNAFAGGSTLSPSSIALASGQIVIGQVSGFGAAESVSGDLTLSTAGVFTVTKTNSVPFTVLATTVPGTGVAAALAANVGSAGAPLLFNGAGGTPSSIALTNGSGLPTTGLTGVLQAAQEPAHTGDATNSAGSLALALATVNANVGTFGSATQCDTITVNAKGLTTAASQTACTPAIASVTGLGASVATALGNAANANGGFPVYSSGSWTPTLTTTGTVGTPTYTIQVGTYEQIGRQVTVRFNITLSGWTGSPTGNVSVAGLPLTSANVANDIGACHFATYAVAGLLASNILTGQINPNTATLALGQVSSSVTSPVTQAQVGLTPTLVGTCSYHT